MKKTYIFAATVAAAAGSAHAQINGTGAPSTSRSQVVVSTGIRHRF
ncbi:hypothetical protein LMG28688_00334 [Paraburkholderia caffeinitolerans]|uniref:Porin domain-containing protein n=1 Tax=Paraburkholderia caffeinitolerans TaxID=1723730 RepID=A0A6J5FCA0_9BURK|nr:MULTISPECIES: hypothetical protein [Paraburkholderia]CAB3777334.1 hypothetical protein LMG28688_00334 [Paraburkholderia caffeinitolerans]